MKFVERHYKDPVRLTLRRNLTFNGYAKDESDAESFNGGNGLFPEDEDW